MYILPQDEWAMEGLWYRSYKSCQNMAEATGGIPDGVTSIMISLFLVPHEIPIKIAPPAFIYHGQDFLKYYPTNSAKIVERWGVTL